VVPRNPESQPRQVGRGSLVRMDRRDVVAGVCEEPEREAKDNAQKENCQCGSSGSRVTHPPAIRATLQNRDGLPCQSLSVSVRPRQKTKKKRPTSGMAWAVRLPRHRVGNGLVRRLGPGPGEENGLVGHGLPTAVLAVSVLGIMARPAES